MATVIFLIVLMSMTFAKLLIHGLFLVHKLQQLGYYNLKLMKWLERNQYRSILVWNIFELIIPLLIIFILSRTIKGLQFYKYITSTIMFLTFSWKLAHPFLSGWIGPRANVKVPLVYTMRVKRLLFTLVVVILSVLIFVFWFTATPFDEFSLKAQGFYRLNAFLLLISVISPILVLTANIINLPFEKFLHRTYFVKAKNKVINAGVKNVCITGSYGKTSTKFFIGKILEEKYRTIVTPSSYNTPMGVSKVINQNDLDSYEMFVVEMGADRKGDINTLCKLVKPDFGIVTAIDIQHLDTFETVENIITTKLSLFKNVKPDGFGVYNYDSRLLRESINKKHYTIPLYNYSMDEANIGIVDICARDVRHTREGICFTAVLKSGESLEIQADVLGRHNALNLLAGILTARLIGLDDEAIKCGVKKIESVPHRLQKIVSPSGVLVLDDAFNANFNGATEALSVLKEIEGNKKILVTPGLISLAEKEDEYNYEIGKMIPGSCDIAILVGKEKTKKILEGIREVGFDESNLHIVNSLQEAQKIYEKLLVRGDVILFENDLPDTFNE